jgi:hypothetical protein
MLYGMDYCRFLMIGRQRKSRKCSRRFLLVNEDNLHIETINPGLKMPILPFVSSVNHEYVFYTGDL